MNRSGQSTNQAMGEKSFDDRGLPGYGLAVTYKLNLRLLLGALLSGGVAVEV
jgi:hypothetical protein